jgi:hypothetical protein
MSILGEAMSGADGDPMLQKLVERHDIERQVHP